MYNNIMYNNIMYKSIILSSYLFGSVYLFSKSLKLINQSYLENKKIPTELILVNSLTFVLTGSLVMYNFNLVNLNHLK